MREILVGILAFLSSLFVFNSNPNLRSTPVPTPTVDNVQVIAPRSVVQTPIPSPKSPRIVVNTTPFPLLKPVATPLPTKDFPVQTPGNLDTIPPTTNVFYPQPNASITYKIDNKVCAITTAPSDNITGFNEIETEYKFDDGNWSGYGTVRGYLCADLLANGPHTLSYHSRDKAGNVENTKILQFTVNIPGN